MKNLIALVVVLYSIKSYSLDLACADKENCNPSVAAIEIDYPQTGPLDHCTGFLIAPDLVLTNGHCVIGRVGYMGKTRRGQSCTGVKVHFFNTKTHKAESATCRGLAELTEYPVHEGLNVPDYAVLRLDKKINRPAIKIGKQEIKDKEKFSITKVDFTKDEMGHYTATQRQEKNCETDFSTQTMYQPHSRTPVFMVKNCKFIPGNSGSVVTNNNNEAIGLAFRSFVMAGKKVTEGDRAGQYPFAASVVNLSCFDSYLNTESDPEWVKACDATKYIREDIQYSVNLGKGLSSPVWKSSEVSSQVNKFIKYYGANTQINYVQRDGYGVEGTVFVNVYSADIKCIKNPRKISPKMHFPQYHMAAFLDQNYQWKVFSVVQNKSTWTYLGSQKDYNNKESYRFSVNQVTTELKYKTTEVYISACQETNI